MKTDLMRHRRFDSIWDIDFGAARDAHTKIGNRKANEPFQKLKHPFARRWKSRGIRGFIESIDDKVDWSSIRDCKHLFQTVCQSAIARLFQTLAIGHIKIRQDLATRIRTNRELNEKGSD
jgi:hypothetical protein